MEVLRNNEEKVMCPYNPAHYIRKGRMDVHLKKCRQAYKDNAVIAICEFNATHRIPEPELQYHHNICPDRKTVELHVFAEELEMPVAQQTLLPAIPVPVDSSWDDEVVPSYDPKKYCEGHNILRRIDTESASTRRDFRIAERHRHNNLETAGGSSTTYNTNISQSRKVAKSNVNNGNRPNLPPTPAFSQRNIEDAPADITRMMEKVSIIPKAAIIPKPRK